MLYVIAKSSDPADPLALKECSSMVYLSRIDRDGLSFSSMSDAIFGTKDEMSKLGEWLELSYELDFMLLIESFVLEGQDE